MRQIVSCIKARWSFLNADLHLAAYYNEPIVQTCKTSDLEQWHLDSMLCAQGGVNTCKSGGYCDVVTVAFHNADVIEYQNRCLKRFFRYPFRYTVFDNSVDERKANDIAAVCEKNGISYFRLPKQPFLSKGMGSYSHGIACNYVFRNFIQRYSKAKYVALLDHDIFPVADFDIDEKLSIQPFYGLPFTYDKARVMYLWPGYFFVRMDYLQGKTVDMRPSIRLGGDTGVSNWRMYEHPDIAQFRFAHLEHVSIDGSNDTLGMGYSKYDDEWIHCWNASNYAERSNLQEKMALIFSMIDAKLREGR